MQKRNARIMRRVALYGPLGLDIAGALVTQFFLYYSPAPTVITCSGSSAAMGRTYGDAFGTKAQLLIKFYLEMGVCQNNKTLIQHRYSAAAHVRDNLLSGSWQRQGRLPKYCVENRSRHPPQPQS